MLKFKLRGEDLQLCLPTLFFCLCTLKYLVSQRYFQFHRCDSAFLSGVTLMMFACIVWMKLVSYAHTNYDMRQLAKSVNEV